MSYEKPRPYLTLDAWRGFAALWVVLAHACLTLPFSEVASEVNSNQKFYLFNLAGYLGVQIFFVVSGYCIAASAVSSLSKERGVLGFFRARVRRIYPPYLLALLLTVLVGALAAFAFRGDSFFESSALARLDEHPRSAAFYLAQVTLANPVLQQSYVLPISWTLCFEVSFYLIVGLLLFLVFRKGNKFLLLNILHLVTIASLLMLIRWPIRGGYFPLDLWPQFGLGVLAFDILSHPGRRVPRLALAFSALLIVVFAIIYSRTGTTSVFAHWRHSTVPSRVVIALLFTAVLIWLYRHDARLIQFRIIRFFAWLGAFSYTLYLTHFLVLNIVAFIGAKLGMTGALFHLLYLVKIVAAVGFARLCFDFIEKPFMHKPVTSAQKI